MSDGYCERCDFRYPLIRIRTEWSGLRVCPDCFDPRPPELSPPNLKPEGVPLPNAAPEPPDYNLSDNEITESDF